MTRNIFNDPELNSAFAEDGYVIVNLLDKYQIALLNELYERMGPPPASQTFYLSLWHDIPAHRTMVHDHIQQVISGTGKNLLNKYKPIISSFAVKLPGVDSAWHPHQDDTFVDEAHFVSLSIWAPLCDTNTLNGTMKALPGSHRRYTGPRSPNIPRAFSHDMNDIEMNLLDVNLSAGQAIIFDHRLVHASGPNNSAMPRVAVVTVMVPEESSLTYLYLDAMSSPPTVRQYAISERYYLEEPLGESSKEPDPGKFKLLATYPYIETKSISH